jgi:Zn-dependent protease with chaperone function
MLSTSAPSDAEAPFEGTLYDGLTGHPHRVLAEVRGGRLELAQDGWADSVEGALLKRIGISASGLKLGRADRPGWRLTLPAHAERQLAPLLGKPERYGRWIDRFGLIPALSVCAAIAATVVVIGYTAPVWLAPHVPMAWERNVGAAMFGDFGSNRCRNPQGQRALETLVERVAPGATQGPDGIKVAALDVPVFNAAALPGGYIVVFKPAITQTDTDALAGILAHEVAHVRRRHVTEALIRELGIGAMIRLFAGGIGADAEQIVDLSYTRRNEAQADSDAIQSLKRAHISPLPTARLFAKLAKQSGESSSSYDAAFLRSHPLSMARAQNFAASFSAHAQYQPALNPAQTQALTSICDKQ